MLAGRLALGPLTTVEKLTLAEATIKVQVLDNKRLNLADRLAKLKDAYDKLLQE